MSANYKRQIKKFFPPEVHGLIIWYYKGDPEMQKKLKKLHKEINDPKFVIWYDINHWWKPYSVGRIRLTQTKLIKHLEFLVESHEEGQSKEPHHEKNKLALAKLTNKKQPGRIVVKNVALQFYVVQ